MWRLISVRKMTAVLVAAVLMTSVACEDGVIATVPPANSPSPTEVPVRTPETGQPDTTATVDAQRTPFTAETVTATETKSAPGQQERTPVAPTIERPSPSVTTDEPTATAISSSTTEPIGTATVSTASPVATATSLATTVVPTRSIESPTVLPTRSTGEGSGVAVRTTYTVDLSRFEGATLVGSEGIFLADLVPSGESLDSVCNPASEGGSQFSATSIFNESSSYGGKFGANSPFNPDSTTPPDILIDGEVVGQFTTSPFMSDVVDPFGLLGLLGCPTSMQ